MSASRYYSIDDILAEAEPIPVVFQTDAKDLGHLDEQTVDAQDLSAGSRVELPFWLASTLAVREYVLLELPRVFQSAFRARIEADPTVIDLNSKSTYFYEFGMKISYLVKELFITDMLRVSLTSRYQEVVRRTGNRKQAESLEFTSKLANMERILFDSKQSGIVQATKFANRSCTHLTLAPTLASLSSFQHVLQSSINGLGMPNINNNNAPSTATNAPGAGPSQRSTRPDVLRNITNASQPGASMSMSMNGRGGTGTQFSKPTQQQQNRSHSTLAQLSALNAANLPLQSHEKRSYGLKATQQRQQIHAAMQRSTLNTQVEPTQISQLPVAQSRKRKMTQNL